MAGGGWMFYFDCDYLGSEISKEMVEEGWE